MKQTSCAFEIAQSKAYQFKLKGKNFDVDSLKNIANVLRLYIKHDRKSMHKVTSNYMLKIDQDDYKKYRNALKTYNNKLAADAEVKCDIVLEFVQNQLLDLVNEYCTVAIVLTIIGDFFRYKAYFTSKK